MFGLGLPAGSFPLRSQQEFQECYMRRKRRKERTRGENRDDDVKERKAKREGSPDEGREKYEWTGVGRGQRGEEKTYFSFVG